MRPSSYADGHDTPRLTDEAAPMAAAVTDDVVVVLEHAIGEPVVAHEMLDALHHVQLRTLRRQRQQRDIVRHCDVAGEVPPGLIQEQHGVLARADHDADLS